MEKTNESRDFSLTGVSFTKASKVLRKELMKEVDLIMVEFESTCKDKEMDVKLEIERNEQDGQGLIHRVEITLSKKD